MSDLKTRTSPKFNVRSQDEETSDLRKSLKGGKRGGKGLAIICRRGNSGPIPVAHGWLWG